MPQGMSNKIGNVFGVEIPVTLQKQLRVRKLSVAKGDVKNNMVNAGEIRDNDTLVYLANKTSWVRLVSSVNINSKEDMNHFKTYFPNLEIDKPDSLAKNFVLFSGTSKYNKTKVEDLNSKTGTRDSANYELRYGIERDGAYNILGDKEWQDFGARPMPGITDVKIETLGKLGSVRSATINFKAWNKYQLDVVDALYFKMGYTMFLEWGHAVYINNKEQVYTSTYSIVDPFSEDLSKEELARQIAQGVEDSNGNYDAMLGMCTNFTFDFNKEGGYDCTMKIIALGGLADAIKINQSKNLSDELKGELKSIVTKINADAKKKAQEEWLRQNQYQIDQRNKEIEEAKKKKEDALKNLGTNVKNLKGKPIREIIKLGYQGLDGFKDYFDTPAQQNGMTIKGSSNNSGVFIVYKDIKNAKTKVNLQKSAIYLDKGFGLTEDVETNQNAYESIVLNSTVFKAIAEHAKTSIETWSSFNQNQPTFTLSLSSQTDASKIKIQGIYNVNGYNFGYKLNIDNTQLKAYESYTVAAGQATKAAFSFKNVKGRVFGKPDQGILTELFDDIISGFSIDRNAPANTVTIKIKDDGEDNFIDFESVSGGKAINVVASNNGTNNSKDYKDINSRSLKIVYNYLAQIDVTDSVTVAAQGQAFSTQTSGVATSISSTVSFELCDPDAIKSVKLKSPGSAILASLEFEKLQNDQDAAAKKAQAETVEVPKPIEVPPISIDEVTAEEASKYHSNLEYFLRAIQIHSINKTLSSTELKVREIDLEKDDFIYRLMSKGFIPQEVLKEFSNTAGSKLPDKWKITNLDNITGYTPRQKLVYSFASYGFNHNLMSRPNYSKEQVEDIPQHSFHRMFTSYVIPYNPIQSIVKDVKIGHPVYIPLGLVIFALNQMCIIYDSPDKKNPDMSPNEQFPMMYLDFNEITNTCLTEPAQLSTDPYKFLIQFRCSDKEYANLFAGAVTGIEDENTSGEYINNILKQLNQGGLFKPESQDKLSNSLPFFKDADDQSGESAYRGHFMNTLINIDYLLDLCKKFGKEDESESVYLKPFLQQLISDLGKSLGDINFFRLAYNDQSNCMYITDDQVSPLQSGEKYVPTVNMKAYEASSELPVYGKYSIAKSLSIKTEVSNKLSNMLAISANSKNKSSLSKDATPFGIYNVNFVDRYKKQAQEIVDDGGKQTRSDISNALFFNQFVKLALSTDSPTVDDVPQATNYYIDRMNKRKSINPATRSSAMIPVSVNITFEGISGFYMGHTFTLPDEILPYTYTRPAIASNGAIPAGKRVGFVVVGVDHTLQDNQWLTNLRANMIYVKDTRDFKNDAGLNRNKLAQGTFESILPRTDDQGSYTSPAKAGASGYLSESDLKSIGIGDHKLQIDAANAFIRMADAARSQGITPKLAGSYRTFANQDIIFDWDLYVSTGGNRSDDHTNFNRKAKKTKAGTNGTVAAAFPGTSNHGWGTAIDATGEDWRKFIRNHGVDYGWSWYEGRRVNESWHFTYDPSKKETWPI